MSLVYLILCCAAFYSAFCRLWATNRGTALSVRLVFCGVGSATAFSAFSVAVWGYEPRLPDVITMGAFAAMLIITRARWKAGVPVDYQKPTADPPKRRASDWMDLTPRHTTPWGEP